MHRQQLRATKHFNPHPKSPSRRDKKLYNLSFPSSSAAAAAAAAAAIVLQRRRRGDGVSGSIGGSRKEMGRRKLFVRGGVFIALD